MYKLVLQPEIIMAEVYFWIFYYLFFSSIISNSYLYSGNEKIDEPLTWQIKYENKEWTANLYKYPLFDVKILHQQPTIFHE